MEDLIKIMGGENAISAEPGPFEGFRASEQGLSNDLKASGLKSRDAQRRLRQHGTNELERDKKAMRVDSHGYLPVLIQTVLLIALLQTCNASKYTVAVVIIMLLARAGYDVYSSFYGHDSLWIIRKKANIQDLVLRDGTWQRIERKNIVPGDIIQLERGEVPADGIILGSDTSFTVNDLPLTGQSNNVRKKEGDVILSTSLVFKGGAYMRVTKTGKDTMVGEAQRFKEGLPLLGHIKKPLSYFKDMPKVATIALLCIATPIAGAILLLGLLQHVSYYHVMVASLSLSLVSVPLELFTKIRRLYTSHLIHLALAGAYCRKAAALDDLAQMDILLADKTGTMSQNDLEVMNIWCFSGVTRRDMLLTLGLANSPGETLDAIDKGVKKLLLRHPGVEKERSKYQREHHSPFNPYAKRTANLHRAPNGTSLISIRGAPLFTLKAVTDIDPVPEEAKEEYRTAMNVFTQKGLICVGVARKVQGEKWQMLGLCAFQDPIRPDTAAAIHRARLINLQVKVMSNSAAPVISALTQQAGMGSELMDARDISFEYVASTSPKMDRKIMLAAAFHDTFPQHKYNAIHAMQRMGLVVGCTGDGINDVYPFLKADISLAVYGAADGARSASSITFVKPGIFQHIQAVIVARQFFHISKSTIICNLALLVQLQVILAAWVFIYQRPFDPLLIVLLLMIPMLSRDSMADFYPWRSLIVQKLKVQKLLAQSCLTATVLVMGLSLTLYTAAFLATPEVMYRIVFLHVALSESWLPLVSASAKPYRPIKPSPMHSAYILVVNLAAILFSATGCLASQDDWAPLSSILSTWIIAAATVYATLLADNIFFGTS